MSDPTTEAGRRLVGRPATKHRHSWLDGTGVCLVCGTTRYYVPIERGIELGRPTLNEVLAIEAEAVARCTEALIAAVREMPGQDITVTRDYAGVHADAMTLGRFEVPPATVTITNAPPTSGLVDRAAVLALIERLGSKP